VLRLRVLSAAVLVPLFLGLILVGQPWVTVIVAALSVIVAAEVARLFQGAGFPVERVIVLVSAPLAVLGLPWLGERVGIAAGFAGAVLVVSAIAAFRRSEPRDGFMAWIATSFAALYASLLAFVPAIVAVAPNIPPDSPLARVLDAGGSWLLILVLTVWSFDTAAYLAGRTLKRGRFLNHISPQKTWSGVIGGTIAAVAVSAILVVAAGQHVLGGVLLGLVVAVAAQAGDVAESLLKRAAGAKDSGTLIPGHGGLLDRVDSFLFAAPAMYICLTWIQLLAVASPA